MNLKEFTKQTIEDITSAVEEVANNSERVIQLRDSGDGRRTIEFDVAVSVEEKNDAGGAASITVLNVFTIGGGGQKEIVSSTVSHIQFGVNVSQYKKGESIL